MADSWWSGIALGGAGTNNNGDVSIAGGGAPGSGIIDKPYASLEKKIKEFVPDVAGDAIKNITEGITGDVGAKNDSTLGQGRYSFRKSVFPSDLGSNASFNGHYMVININVQESSRFQSGVGGLNITPLNEYSKTDVLRYNIDPRVDAAFVPNTKFSRPRFTKRIAESIAIFMPSSQIEYTDRHKFEEVSIASFAGPVVRFFSTAAAGAVGGLLGGTAGAAMAAGGVGNIINGLGQTITNVSRLGGFPINPKVEILYGSTDQRQFRFDFLMSPSNVQESQTIENIIKTLRFHAAPELRPGEVSSFFWIPPAEFDITFYQRGVENTKIPQINTCVLEQIDVSYSPSGIYSTFYNGYPVQIRMQLTFRETEIVHKRRVAQGF